MPEQTPVLPDPKTAYDHVFGNVFTTAFFNKLARHGRVPTSEKQAQEYLLLAGNLEAIEADPRVKAANDANDPIAEANAALAGAAQKHGLGTFKTAATQAADSSRRQAAIQMASDPGIYSSMLSLKAAEAAEVGRRFGIA